MGDNTVNLKDAKKYEPFVNFVINELKRGRNGSSNVLKKLEGTLKAIQNKGVDTPVKFRQMKTFLQTLFNGLKKENKVIPSHIDVGIFYEPIVTKSEPKSEPKNETDPEIYVIRLDDDSDDEIQFVSVSSIENSKSIQSSEGIKFEEAKKTCDKPNASHTKESVPLFHRREKPTNNNFETTLPLTPAINSNEFPRLEEIAVELSDEECVKPANGKCVKPANEKCVKPANEKCVKPANEKCVKPANEKCVKPANNERDLLYEEKSTTELQTVLENMTKEVGIDDIDECLQVGSELIEKNRMYLNHNDPRSKSVRTYVKKKPAEQNLNVAASTLDVNENTQANPILAQNNDSRVAIETKLANDLKTADNWTIIKKKSWMKENMNNFSEDAVSSLFDLIRKCLSSSPHLKQKIQRRPSTCREINILHRDLRESFIGNDLINLPPRRKSYNIARRRISMSSRNFEMSDNNSDTENISAKQKARRNGIPKETSVTASQVNCDIQMKAPIIKLARVSSRRCTIGSSQSKSNVLPQETEIVSNDNWILVPIKSIPEPDSNNKKTSTTKVVIRKKNIDIKYTFLSDLKNCCVICNTKPHDPVNHYINIHKCEVFISRFGEKDLLKITRNPVICNRIKAKSNVYHLNCPICSAELTHTFQQIMLHLSTHTGEYSYQCSICNLTKPYKKDIDAHVSHNKRCCKASVLHCYRYNVSNEINAYVCKLCNFTQLNRANIRKHLQEQHDINFIEINILEVLMVQLLEGRNTEVINQNNKIMVEIHNQNTPDNIFERALTNDIKPDFPDFYNNCAQESQETKNANVTKALDPFENYINPTSNLLTMSNSIPKDTSPSIGGVPVPLFEVDIKPPIEELQNGLHFTDEVESSLALWHDLDSSEPVTNFSRKRSSEMESLKNNNKKLKRRSESVDSHTIKCGFYRCVLPGCLFSVHTQTELQRHLKDVHNGPEFKQQLKCLFCHEKDTHSDRLIFHMNSKHAKCRYQCCKCEYRALCPTNVLNHEKLLHPKIRNNRIICCDPGQAGKHLAQLEQYYCPICPEILRSIEKLKLHVKNKHSVVSRKKMSNNFVCIYDNCKYSSNELSFMERHLCLNHPEENMFVCKVIDNDSQKKVAQMVAIEIRNLDNESTVNLISTCIERNV